MDKGRCVIKNLIGKTSAVFALILVMTTATGCGDAVIKYLQDNNLVSPDKYGDKKDEQVEETQSETETESEFDAPTFSFEAQAEDSAAESDTEASAATSEQTKDTADTTADAAEAEDADSSSEGSTLDIDKVNKSIDDLIARLEEETGRTNRSEKTEAPAEGKGKDATTYYSDTYQNAQRASIGILDSDIDVLKESQRGKYAFEHLTDEGKTLYCELLAIIQHRAEDVVISTLDEETLDVVCNFVLADHPEIFYMDGYTFTRYTIGGTLKKLSFTGNYIYSADEIAHRQAQIDEYSDKCLAGVPVGGDDYSKVKYVYDYLITNTEYDSSAPDNQNICSVFISGRSVCQGYAKATQYLLDKLSIPATLVTGKVNDVWHAWNLIYADGEYTYVDTTWGDSSYQRIESGDNSQKMPLINYTYLCCTTQDIKKTHVISETLPMPECTSMKNNYYVREGEYFTECDMNAVGELFARRYADGSNNVTIKCSTEPVYNDIKGKLFDAQQVFGFMDGSNNTVSYTTFDDQYILIIWLY
ncbi:transglutaminase domain-containing protein [Butyrivibrio sp. WCD3002]|uniref:transglutaminase domain-containing protein n=1 Tax=Butyrivibrio sp. WCD3002 TaxID=1280676 RepID=UPI0004169E1D|nr:transglutaminase domain-containing protein [Butyrivibrio sp. WCD3002]